MTLPRSETVHSTSDDSAPSFVVVFREGGPSGGLQFRTQGYRADGQGALDLAIICEIDRFRRNEAEDCLGRIASYNGILLLVGDLSSSGHPSER